MVSKNFFENLKFLKFIEFKISVAKIERDFLCGTLLRNSSNPHFNQPCAEENKNVFHSSDFTIKVILKYTDAIIKILLQRVSSNCSISFDF